tara:strand:+ start:204 stop:353 length:150 start_codon:yes stop_codon:yes gene_type:complete
MRAFITILIIATSNILLGQELSNDTLSIQQALDSNFIEIEIEGYSGKPE